MQRRRASPQASTAQKNGTGHVSRKNCVTLVRPRGAGPRKAYASETAPAATRGEAKGTVLTNGVGQVTFLRRETRGFQRRKGIRS